MNKLTTPASDEYAEFYAGCVQRAAARGDALTAGWYPAQISSGEMTSRPAMDHNQKKK